MSLSPLYLAGLFESRIRCYSKQIDKSLLFTLSNESLVYFDILSKELSLSVRKPTNASYCIKLGIKKMIPIAQRFVLLKTPFAEFYKACIELNEKRTKVTDKTEIDKLIAQVISSLSLCRENISQDTSYLAGVLEGEDRWSIECRNGRDFTSFLPTESASLRNYIGSVGKKNRVNAAVATKLESLISSCLVRPDYYRQILSYRSRTIRDSSIVKERLKLLRYPQNDTLINTMSFFDTDGFIHKNRVLSEEKTLRKLIKRQERETRRIRNLEKSTARKTRMERLSRIKKENVELLIDGLKKCVKCNSVFPIKHYHKNAHRPDGLGPYCKECTIEWYFVPKRVEIALRVRRYQYRNPDKKRAQNLRDANKPEAKTRESFNTKVKKMIGGSYRPDTLIPSIGCSSEALKKHLSDRFESGMTWDLYGKREGFQIDHVIPCIAFDHTNPRLRSLISSMTRFISLSWACIRRMPSDRMARMVWSSSHSVQAESVLPVGV